MNAPWTLVFDPILPVPVITFLGLVLLGGTLFAYGRVGAGLSLARRGALLVCRVAGLALVLALLLQPSRQENIPPPTRERVTLVAVDSSLSMKQRDVGGATRLEAAKNLLLESGAVGRNGLPDSARLRLFEFSADAQSADRPVFELVPRGSTTHFHRSVSTLLNAPSAGEQATALVLLTDGHDFELVNPVKTGAAARLHPTPLYAVALGRQGKVRDVSVRIASFQPYTYVRQKARVGVSLRLIGCELEDLQVQLLRHGQVAQTRRLNAEEAQELAVEFEVEEPAVGQFEYEVRVQPLEHEVDLSNNSALTYLNVIDQQIRVLLLEGDPYWDTTFLQRSLLRNDKFNVDALLRYGKDRVRAIRKEPKPGDFKAPATLDEFAAYDVLVLGRCVDQLLTPAQIAVLDQFVKDRGGTVIFSRGRAFGEADPSSELEPVLWGGTVRDRVRLEAAPEGRSLAAFRNLAGDGAGLDALPEMFKARQPQESRPLTSTLALGTGRDDANPAPAIVHRRYGSGQVVSLGVEGLWRWGLNPKTQGVNTAFDRFWDQMILWLLAGRDFIPSRQFSFRPQSANILLGEKVHFRLAMRQPDPTVKTVPLAIFREDTEAGRANLAATLDDPGRLTAEFLPERTGRYRAQARFPDGSTQDSRFIVYTENLEETEVATDVTYLRRLCQSSGGRMIEPAELGPLLKELRTDKTEATPQTRRCPIWNSTWVFYLAGLLFGLDWLGRRRWGLC